ncbi:hypothetical protein ABT369_05660 [Dactylosporangium sp. NPDC000244]|uniref:hypothetical protein n=1 Tax=Dactylosporangium sp. NPDC000244 TaxID=3154365 RepID=UPI0033240C1F
MEVLTAATLAAPVAAHAGPANPNVLRNAQTGRCIQMHRRGDPVFVSTQPCDATNDDQRFRLTVVGKSSDRYHVVKFQNVGTGYCPRLL